MRFTCAGTARTGAFSWFGRVWVRSVSSRAALPSRWPTPRRAPGAILGIREVGEGVPVLRASREQLVMQPRKGFGRAVIRTQPENQLAARCDEATGAVDQLLDHRLQTPALGGVTHRGLLAHAARATPVPQTGAGVSGFFSRLKRLRMGCILNGYRSICNVKLMTQDIVYYADSLGCLHSASRFNKARQQFGHLLSHCLRRS